ncbi:MAG: ribonuclease P protein component, partial [Anaerolineales bacterium]
TQTAWRSTHSPACKMAWMLAARGAWLQRQFRLTRSQDFQRVRRSGKSFAHPLLVLAVRANDATDVHVGVAAGRTIGTAVRRNRAKRLLRAAMQGLIDSVAPGWDILLIARPALVSRNVFEVREALLTLLRRAGLPVGPVV